MWRARSRPHLSRAIPELAIARPGVPRRISGIENVMVLAIMRHAITTMATAGARRLRARRLMRARLRKRRGRTLMHFPKDRLARVPKRAEGVRVHAP